MIEAVGTEQAMRTVMDIIGDGGSIGCAGVPHGSGMPDLLDGTIDPSPVFGLTPGLDEVPVGSRAMDERTALKVLITP